MEAATISLQPSATAKPAAVRPICLAVGSVSIGTPAHSASAAVVWPL